MSKKPNTITWDVFILAVRKMQASGEKITVRSVLRHTGGSFTKIADFIATWRGEHQTPRDQHVQTLTGEIAALDKELRVIHTRVIDIIARKHELHRQILSVSR